MYQDTEKSKFEVQQITKINIAKQRTIYRQLHLRCVPDYTKTIVFLGNVLDT